MRSRWSRRRVLRAIGIAELRRTRRADTIGLIAVARAAFARRARPRRAYRTLGFRRDIRKLGGRLLDATGARLPRQIDAAAEGLIVIGRRLLVRRGLAARIGRFQRQFGDAFAHLDGEIAKVQVRPLQLFGEYSREHRIVGGVVAAEPIQRGLADAGGIQREDATRGLGIGQTARVADRAAGGTWERIVAAGIDHQERDANRARLQFRDQIGLGQRCTAHARFGAFGHGRDIARDQVIDATIATPCPAKNSAAVSPGCSRAVNSASLSTIA